MTASNSMDIHEEWSRLKPFLAEEWQYYDGIPDLDPDRIVPVDVLAPVMMNAYWRATAAPLREIHRHLAKVSDPLLRKIPIELQLDAAGEDAIHLTAALLSRACELKGVNIAVACKVLLRKRPNLIPMLDFVIRKHYTHLPGQWGLGAKLDSPASRDEGLARLLGLVRKDLLRCRGSLEELVHMARVQGWEVSALRIMEALMWTALEPNGHYRVPAGLSLYTPRWLSEAPPAG